MPTYITACKTYEKQMKAMVSDIKKLYKIEGRTTKIDCQEERGRRLYFSTKENSYIVRLWTASGGAGNRVIIDYTLFREEDNHGVEIEPPAN